ncbi:hypothetical protein [Thermobifida cellulosilytica]|uniref:DUF5709 domain-containing protein n=1 Tax=Thermobifida cellulosilytica TB100 TaxID=665004 RepID=A0A147KHL5_THECS|nr:hypothetical protein [Thermobifida cellulosilytica]KUP96776.1 hypothetical protein AC529_10645 [Thermobifida cellulosilytica TB100]
MAEMRDDRRTDPVLPEDLDEGAVSEEQAAPSEEAPHDRAEDPIHALDSDFEDAGQPALADTTEDTVLPGDRPVAMDEFGTTGTDKEAGEPLDTALSREEPDVWTREAEPGQEGADVDFPAAERPPSEDAGLDRGGLGPEERAVRVREER